MREGYPEREGCGRKDVRSRKPSAAGMPGKENISLKKESRG